MFIYIYLKILSWTIGIIATVFFVITFKKKYKPASQRNMRLGTRWVSIGLLAIFLAICTYASNPNPIHFALPPMMQSHAPGKLPAFIPIKNIIKFFTDVDNYERIENIGADPNDVPNITESDSDGIVHINVEAKEVISEIGEGIHFNYWTYNEQVPGPMMRVKYGDTVEITLTNHESSQHSHNIDLHAVTGPGGGARASMVQPGETKSFRFKAINPGLYVYHCATPNISTHNAHGQYGMILVEPEGGLQEVDKEFYIMQGELYTQGGLGPKGLVAFDASAMLDGIPSYVTFNGRLEETPRMQAQVGDRVRMYIGNGGVNLISSFHVIGEIFDVVYPEAAIGSDVHTNVQTTAVLPGGASIVEFTVDVPGDYILVDHALARMNKGAWAILHVEGAENPEVFAPL